MKYQASSAGQRLILWFLFILRLRKCFKLQYFIIMIGLLILLIYLRLVIYIPSDQSILSTYKPMIKNDVIVYQYTRLNVCNSDGIEFLFHSNLSNNNINDSRPQPTIERLQKLFQILISYEEKYRTVFDYLGIFRFTDLYHTLRPFANYTERLQKIHCFFQNYINVSGNGRVVVTPNFTTYLKQASSYLSDGFRNQHLMWTKTSIDKIQKPVIVLAASAQFYNSLQASMRTINKYLMDYTVAIYDLRLHPSQLSMVKDNCDRCTIIPFPFVQIESVAAHVQILGNFAWKPIIIQDAVQRFGSIIYGDTSIRYQTSNFDRLRIDNVIRGFSCRELPGHYLPCFTLSDTFSWFHETSSTFDDVYIAEAGFISVTDNFLSRLILKTWVTCALDLSCIAPWNSRTQCKHKAGLTHVHRYDQSAMVITLSFYFFPSSRQNDKSDPAPYDMYASIQAKIAEVRRFEGDSTFFTKRLNINLQKNVSGRTVTVL